MQFDFSDFPLKFHEIGQGVGTYLKYTVVLPCKGKTIQSWAIFCSAQTFAEFLRFEALTAVVTKSLSSGI